MFASHFARAKAAQEKKQGPATNDKDEAQKNLAGASPKAKRKRRKAQKKHDSTEHSREKEQIGKQKSKPATSTESNESSEKQPSKKRRRHESAGRGPRRVRPTPQALELSRQLQELSRQKKLKELTNLFWNPVHAAIRDNHHVCIVVDCCSRCGNVEEAERAVQSLSADLVTVETKTALLKCYAHTGDLDKAMTLFRDMCRRTASDPNKQHQRPNIRTLNTLLRGCLWTAATSVIDDKGKTRVVGGVVSSEEAWKLYQTLHQNDEESTVDTSSYEAAIILLCQALRVDEAQARIQQLQEQYNIQCKGKASIKGGDQSSLETCGIAYLSLARAQTLLSRLDDMWLSCQRCLHAIQASRVKLEKEEIATDTTNLGGKRGWKVDSSEDGQKRAASNLAYRRHRLNEVQNEARALLTRRSSTKELVTFSLSERLRSKLIYFAGGGTINSAESVNREMHGSSAAWHSFGLETLMLEKNKKDLSRTLTADGYADISQIFSKERRKNPIDIEIGSGFGDWIVRQALAFSDRNHFAVELRADRVYQIFSRGSLTGTKALENLCTVGGDSASFLRDRIAKGTVSSVFANHPEPPTQTLGQNVYGLEGLMGNENENEPVHMLNSTLLSHATDALTQGGRLVIVTDNRNYGNLICATFVRLLRKRKGALRCLDASQAKKMKLKPIETFPERISLYEGQPSLQVGHARDEMLAGQSYFDRLWKTGAGSHSERTRRYLIVMYKQ